jgi:hypothetical protein
VGDLQSLNQSVPFSHRHTALRTYGQCRSLQANFDVFRNHTGEGKEQDESVYGFMDIHGRLPADGIGARSEIAQKAPVQSFRLVGQFDGVKPHQPVMSLSAHCSCRL